MNENELQQLAELAEKFEEAGHGNISIAWEDLKILGITKQQKTFQSKKYGKVNLITGNWEDFCCFVHEKAFGKPHPGATARGRGFRSQIFGKTIAEKILDKISMERQSVHIRD